MNDADLKRKRIETLVKVGGLGLVGLLVAPFVFVAIKGLIGLVVAAGISFGVISFLPYFAMKIANWRLKAIKSEAMKNPVETLQNQLVEKTNALQRYQEQLATLMAQISDFADEVKQYIKDGLEDAPVYQEQLDKLKQMLKMRQQKFSQTKQDLADFADSIERAERKWKMACAAAAISEAAGDIDGDIFDKICIETSLNSIQTKLNRSFADIELAFADEANAKKIADSRKAVSLVNAEANTSPVPPRQAISIS